MPTFYEKRKRKKSREAFTQFYFSKLKHKASTNKILFLYLFAKLLCLGLVKNRLAKRQRLQEAFSLHGGNLREGEIDISVPNVRDIGGGGLSERIECQRRETCRKCMVWNSLPTF